MIIALGLCLDHSRQINHLPSGRGFGEGQARSFTTRLPDRLPLPLFFPMASLPDTRCQSPGAYGMPDGKARNTGHFAGAAMRGRGRCASRLSPRQGAMPDASGRPVDHQAALSGPEPVGRDVGGA